MTVLIPLGILPALGSNIAPPIIHSIGRADLPVDQDARECALAWTVDTRPVHLSDNPLTHQSKMVAAVSGGCGANHPQLSPHSALMGGQFPIEKRRDAFKTPIFYAGKFFGILPKMELPEFDSLKMCFDTASLSD